MALLAPIPTEYGFPACYHRIALVQVAYAERFVDVVLASYGSADARQAAGRPLAEVGPFRLTYDELGVGDAETPTRGMIYAKLKSKADAAPAGDPLCVLAGAGDDL